MPHPKLVDLNPQWVGDESEEVTLADGTKTTARVGIALSFDCPCVKKCGGRLMLPLRAPLDGGPPITASPYESWYRSPDKAGKDQDLETLTIRPSVWFDKADGGCGVHFWLSNGECQLLVY